MEDAIGRQLLAVEPSFFSEDDERGAACGSVLSLERHFAYRIHGFFWTGVHGEGAHTVKAIRLEGTEAKLQVGQFPAGSRRSLGRYAPYLHLVRCLVFLSLFVLYPMAMAEERKNACGTGSKHCARNTPKSELPRTNGIGRAAVTICVFAV